jgi:lactoylglutathione lyase
MRRVIVQANGDAVQSSTITSQDEVLEWGKMDNRRLLHVVYRVGDLDKTIRYSF